MMEAWTSTTGSGDGSSSTRPQCPTYSTPVGCGKGHSVRPGTPGHMSPVRGPSSSGVHGRRITASTGCRSGLLVGSSLTATRSTTCVAVGTASTRCILNPSRPAPTRSGERRLRLFRPNETAVSTGICSTMPTATGMASRESAVSAADRLLVGTGSVRTLERSRTNAAHGRANSRPTIGGARSKDATRSTSRTDAAMSTTTNGSATSGSNPR